MQMQEALADFIEEDILNDTSNTCAPIYEQRRLALIHSLKQHLENRVTIYGDNAGLHVMARSKQLFRSDLDRSMCQGCVGLISTASNYYGQAPRGEYIFGFANLMPEEIREGIRRLGRYNSPC